MTITDCILISQKLLERFGIIPDSDPAHEVWGRHFDNWDEETFIEDHGLTDDNLEHQILEWMLQKADDYYHDEFREPKPNAVAKKFIKAVWTAGMHKGTYDEYTIEEYPFIKKEVAKTLPEGTREMTYNGRTGRTTHRVIKNGKWVRG